MWGVVFPCDVAPVVVLFLLCSVLVSSPVSFFVALMGCSLLLFSCLVVLFFAIALVFGMNKG